MPPETCKGRFPICIMTYVYHTNRSFCRALYVGLTATNSLRQTFVQVCRNRLNWAISDEPCAVILRACVRVVSVKCPPGVWFASVSKGRYKADPVKPLKHTHLDKSMAHSQKFSTSFFLGSSLEVWGGVWWLRGGRRDPEGARNQGWVSTYR